MKFLNLLATRLFKEKECVRVRTYVVAHLSIAAHVIYIHVICRDRLCVRVSRWNYYLILYTRNCRSN